MFSTHSENLAEPGKKAYGMGKNGGFRRRALDDVMRVFSSVAALQH